MGVPTIMGIAGNRRGCIIEVILDQHERTRSGRHNIHLERAPVGRRQDTEIRAPFGNVLRG